MDIKRKKIKVTRVFGVPVIKTEETFEIKSYPKRIRRVLEGSNLPQEFYPYALAVIGKAFFKTQKLWGDRMSGVGLDWKVPMPSDFDEKIQVLKSGLNKDSLLKLSEDLFANINTSENLLINLKNQIALIIDGAK